MRTAGKGSGGSVGDRSNRLSQYTLYVHLYIGLIDSSSIHHYTLYSIHILKTCSDGDLFTNTLYLWSRGGQPYSLPGDVGLPIGGDTKHQYLVLQLHYLNVDLLPASGDTSGVDLHYTELEPEKSAGLVSVHVTTHLPPFSQTYQDGGCRIAEQKRLHPLSYIVHTHARGQVVSLWRVRRQQGGAGQDDWTLLGKKSPQAGQSFYPVAEPGLVLEEGDRLAVRCTMTNLSSRTVRHHHGSKFHSQTEPRTQGRDKHFGGDRGERISDKPLE